jgi:nicotinamidase-related amidase
VAYIVSGHPIGHISFASTHSRAPFTEISVPKLYSEGKTTTQMLWPEHCVQGTHGSQIEQGVQTRLDALDPGKVVYIRKVSRLTAMEGALD